MPGPVSDSYDPEFGTGANSADVATAVRRFVARFDKLLGPELKNIVEVVHGPAGLRFDAQRFTERDARIIRFALNRALETL